MEALRHVIIKTKTEHDFQFEPSFGPYLRFLQQRLSQSVGIRQKFYTALIKKLQQRPELLVPFGHHFISSEHREQMDLIQMSLLPLMSVAEDYPMALAFMRPEIFFNYTDSFKRMVIDQEIDFTTTKDEYNLLRYFQKHILERYYKRWPDNIQHFFKKAYVEENKAQRHFRIEIDSRFTEVNVIDQLPEYKPEWHELLYLPEKEYLASRHRFPFSSFKIEGFLIIHIKEVSEQAAINKLNNAILKNIPNISLEETLSKVQIAMGELLNDANIKIGITPFFNINGETLFNKTFDSLSILVNVNDDCPETRMGLKDIRELFGQSQYPFIFSKSDEHLRKKRTFLKGLEEKNIRSYMAYPIFTRDGLLGIFELGSHEADVITEATIMHIQLALPIINDVAYFMMQSFKSMLDQVVKQQFTSLQPSVEWKFKKTAFAYLSTTPEERGLQQISNIFFEDVYPLYGAIDIRNSSVERNGACTADYLHQIESATDLLKHTGSSVSLPLIEGLEYKCRNFLTSLNSELTVENELKVNDFFQDELEPMLTYLLERHPEFAEVIETYQEGRDLKTGIFHQNRRAFETSVKLINDQASLFFENEVEKLQKTYPFYFEKYRTDGVEYNIYIGPSIAPSQPYSVLHLKNLRLWQISSMVEIARICLGLKDQLPVFLETTQLILVYSQPIDISFRKDERRFDVDGSYNIKYEVIKKRIDKVKIKTSHERLTKPGSIAIVFNNEKSMEEYRHHIEFLQDKGLLTKEVESFELEDLQGISGLKAMRLSINYIS